MHRSAVTYLQEYSSNKGATRCHAHNIRINDGAWSSPLKSARSPFDRRQKEERAW